MLPFVVAGIAALSGLAYVKAKKASETSTYGVLTPTRKYILTRALDAKKDPAWYRNLADGFAKEGLPDEAELLRKRAALGEMTPEQKQSLKGLVQKALASNKPEGIKAVSDYMLSIGALGNAAKLASHAKAVASANAIPATAPVTVPAPEPAPAPAPVEEPAPPETPAA